MERRSIFPATLLKRLLQGLGGLALLITFGNCGGSSEDKVAFVGTTAESCDAHTLNPAGPPQGQNLIYICPGHPVHLCWSALTRATQEAKIEPEIGAVSLPFGTALVHPSQTKDYVFSGTSNDPPPVKVTVVTNGAKVGLTGRQCSSAGAALAYCFDAGHDTWDSALQATSIIIDAESGSCFANTRWTITHVGINGGTDSTSATTNMEVSVPASWAVGGDWKFIPAGPCTEPPAVVNFRLGCICKQ